MKMRTGESTSKKENQDNNQRGESIHRNLRATQQNQRIEKASISITECTPRRNTHHNTKSHNASISKDTDITHRNAREQQRVANEAKKEHCTSEC